LSKPPFLLSVNALLDYLTGALGVHLQYPRYCSDYAELDLSTWLSRYSGHNRPDSHWCCCRKPDIGHSLHGCGSTHQGSI